MQFGIWIVILLAVIQGLTEFLPVSSSGHLVLVEAVLGGRGEGTGVIFEIAVHVGTLAAIVLVYRRKVLSILGAILSFMAAGFRKSETNREDFAYAGWIILASVPAALVGFLLHDRITGVFDSPKLTSVFLVATGFFIVLSKFHGRERRFSWYVVILIGCAQAVAILPGCSRSGWTITTALLLGLEFERAAEFSFLLSIPAIMGALVFELIKNPVSVASGTVVYLLIGAAAAFVSGWAALRLVLLVLGKGTFHRFAYYLLPVGAAAFIFFTMYR